MRINQFLARATGLSRRTADKVIETGEVTINGTPAIAGQQVSDQDEVLYKGTILKLNEVTTVILNKPAGYVCSRDGQGSETVYELLPASLHHLKTIGRLDKNSSGLLLLTDDGKLANELTHPSRHKMKVYEVTLNKSLTIHDRKQIEDGVMLEDGVSRLKLSGGGKDWTVTMHEGRNRQIRRTFAALNYRVIRLHRTKFGDYELGNLKLANYSVL